jgi:hypothetical protein
MSRRKQDMHFRHCRGASSACLTLTTPTRTDLLLAAAPAGPASCVSSRPSLKGPAAAAACSSCSTQLLLRGLPSSQQLRRIPPARPNKSSALRLRFQQQLSDVQAAVTARGVPPCDKLLLLSDICHQLQPSLQHSAQAFTAWLSPLLAPTRCVTPCCSWQQGG